MTIEEQLTQIKKEAFEKYRIETAIVKLFDTVGINPEGDDITDLTNILIRALKRQIKQNQSIMMLQKVVLPAEFTLNDKNANDPDSH